MVKSFSLILALLFSSMSYGLNPELLSTGEFTEYQVMDWNWNLRHLNRYCPTKSKVIVLFEEVKDDALGFTAYNETRDTFVITIDKRLCYYMKANTLAHEWGHVITWNEDADDHGEVWGKAYARCYRVVFLGQNPDKEPK